MIRRAFIKRFSVGVLGCGMLAEALLSRGPTMQVVETINRPVAGVDYVPIQNRIDVGPRVRDRKDLKHTFEAEEDWPSNPRRGTLYVDGLRQPR